LAAKNILRGSFVDTRRQKNMQVQDRNQYQGEMETKLQQLGSKIDDMKAKANRVGADAKAEVDKQIEELTAKRVAIQQKLVDLKSSSDDAWKTIQTGIQTAWEDLSTSFEKAAAKF